MTRSRPGASAPPPFLLDTHVWFWYLTEAPRLPSGLRRAIEQARGDVWLSPVSVWEVGLLERHGRIRLRPGLRAWVHEAERVWPLREAPLNREVALVSREVGLPHRDPADHFLAATALVYGLTLVTVDPRLSSARWLPTRST